MNPRTVRHLICLFVALLVLIPRAAAAEPKVYVILWFDTEDYILPASDDAALRVADWLTKEGVRATFKVVGEKARTLEKRGRTDVIEALKKHEIGYHSNFHSVQPTPAQYLSNLGWDEGVAEFDRREKPGRDDVERIFGQAPSCYGQPGSSWGPQSFGAMKKWGMPVYLDAGRHVSLDGKPHYYCGILTLYHLTFTLRTSLGGAEDLKQAEDRFVEARKKLLQEGGGIVSIFYHPCEFVHKQFWDGVNFSKGANPPREQWKLPPQKTAAETKAAYDNFEGYIRFIKRFKDVEFITARRAAELYRDKMRQRQFGDDEFKEIAANVGLEVSFQRRGDLTIAPSEILMLLNDRFGGAVPGLNIPLPVKETPFGPADTGQAMNGPVTTDFSQFHRAAADVDDFIRKNHRVPSTVWLGSTGVTPEAYLAALAKVLVSIQTNKGVSDKIEIKPAKLAAAKYVADDDPKLWGWVIFPPGFRAPALMELAKRQAWTLKPAVLHSEK